MRLPPAPLPGEILPGAEKFPGGRDGRNPPRTRRAGRRRSLTTYTTSSCFAPHPSHPAQQAPAGSRRRGMAFAHRIPVFVPIPRSAAEEAEVPMTRKKAGPGKKTPRKKEPTRPGICCCCRHVTTCSYTKQLPPPVIYCEEFELVESALPRPSAAKPVPPRGGRPGVKPGAVEYGGLCRDCTSRATCALTVCEGGIWHCEEYR